MAKKTKRIDWFSAEKEIIIAEAILIKKEDPSTAITTLMNKAQEAALKKRALKKNRKRNLRGGCATAAWFIDAVKAAEIKDVARPPVKRRPSRITKKLTVPHPIGMDNIPTEALERELFKRNLDKYPHVVGDHLAEKVKVIFPT